MSLVARVGSWPTPPLGPPVSFDCMGEGGNPHASLPMKVSLVSTRPARVRGQHNGGALPTRVGGRRAVWSSGVHARGRCAIWTWLVFAAGQRAGWTCHAHTRGRNAAWCSGIFAGGQCGIWSCTLATCQATREPRVMSTPADALLRRCCLPCGWAPDQLRHRCWARSQPLNTWSADRPTSALRLLDTR